MPTLAVLNLDILGLGILFLVLLIMSLTQAGAALGIMWVMHKYWRADLTETKYGEFDFDQFQKNTFQDLMLRLVILFGGPTIVLHMLESFFIGVSMKRHRLIVCLILFVLEMAAIVAGFHLIFRLDKFRLWVLAAGSALFYLLWLLYLASGRTYLS
jgi:hypothetical protein